MPIPPRRRPPEARRPPAPVAAAAPTAGASCAATPIGAPDARAVRCGPEVDAAGRPPCRARMRLVAARVPGGHGCVPLLPGPGLVPHLEAPAQAMRPRVAHRPEGAVAP